MNAVERNQGERETEVVAKPARRRFTVEYKRKIVRRPARTDVSARSYPSLSTSVVAPTGNDEVAVPLPIVVLALA